MPSAIVGDLLDLMDSTLVAQPGTMDAFGNFTASGDALNLACYLNYENRLVRDSNGGEVVSSASAIVGSVNNLTVDGYRYTVSGEFSSEEAISVQKVFDENGAHHEVVVLP